MKQKITVRLGLFITIIFLLPLIIFIKFSYDSYLEYKEPLVEEIGDSYRICSINACSQFPKRIIDNSKFSSSDFDIESGQYFNTLFNRLKNLQDDPDFNFVNFDIISGYYLALNSAKFARNNSQKIFYFLIFITFVYLLTFLFIWFKNQIILIDTMVRIKSLWLKKISFNVDNVEVIGIVTTTPFIAKRTSIDQINWRDAVGVYYRSPMGNIDNIVIPLYIFPGFKKIIKEIIKRRPSVKIFFNLHMLIEYLIKKGYISSPWTKYQFPAASPPY